MRTRDLVMCTGLLAVIVAAGCAPPPMAMQGTADDEATIRALPAKYAAAFNTKDAAALGAMAAPNYQVVTPDGNLVSGPAGLEQSEGAVMKQMEGMSPTLTATPMFVTWINAENAVMGGSYSVSGLPEGMPNKGSFLVTVTKNDAGQWMLTSSLGADYMPPPPAGGMMEGK